MKMTFTQQSDWQTNQREEIKTGLYISVGLCSKSFVVYKRNVC